MIKSSFAICLSQQYTSILFQHRVRIIAMESTVDGVDIHGSIWKVQITYQTSSMATQAGRIVMKAIQSRIAATACP
jgi:hypothetical protein